MNTEKIKHAFSTPRLILINSTRDLLEEILRSEESFAQMLEIHIANPCSEFGDAPFKYAIEKINAQPETEMWWSWLPILTSENKLIGNCGYKGPPADGIVEIGYEVARDYRQQGYATEMVKALVENAFKHINVQAVIAHTLPEENASVHVLRKCGFGFVEPVDDPEDGLIWKWKLERE